MTPEDYLPDMRKCWVCGDWIWPGRGPVSHDGRAHLDCEEHYEEQLGCYDEDPPDEPPLRSWEDWREP